MADKVYDSLIDSETWAFIQKTENAYPPDTATASILQQREIYDKMCQSFYHGRPETVVTTDLTIAGVRCRHYAGADPHIVYFHGGGFVVGGLHSHDDICAELCEQTGLAVTSVDYRLLPEHPHPAAFDDASAVTQAIAAKSAVILVGDSAGGNLAAAMSHACRGIGGVRILGQVLIYPGLGGDMTQGSYLTHAEAPMLTRADVIYYADLRTGAGDAADPTLSPLRDRSFAGLPPTLAIAAECDPLADDAEHYARAIAAAGGAAVSVTEPVLVHGYLRARHSVPRAARSFARIVSAIKDMSAGIWPLRDAS